MASITPSFVFTSSFRPRPQRTQWTAVLALLACLVCQALVTTATADAPRPIETLEIDTRVPVRGDDGGWIFLSQDEADLRRVKKRAPISSASASDGVTTTFSIAVSTVTGASTTSTVPASPLPSPLDGGLSSNFSGDAGSSPCPGYINSFLTDPTFKQCYPFSLLLQGSRSFFNAEKSLVSITQVLDATCAPNATFCNNYLQQLAKNLTSEANCGPDYQLGNSVVVQAYLAMTAYAPLYGAACLKDPETSMYCFANAVTNLTNPSNTYFYYLPLNISLPGSTVPSCGSCLQQTMDVFQAATANRKQALVSTYPSAAQQVNTICGPNFVNQSLASEIVSSGGPRSLTAGPSSCLMTILFLAALPWLL
ncbi:hypothetical protein QBC46DRAFT_162977 [Diplogelasinospora grovesii]|uniref:DUF7729 domain-containing protein n=1 Tax=Diplogelasinospora grovesii TaxID=303347 RepID=A0AAN6N4P3_9PEZI|nr:hypothetical protein QBC46DRAFT_162977 [Diplogelasinospora grovesii]